MFDSAEQLMYSSGLDIKPSKCEVLYARQSGNNWYKGKREVKQNIYIQGNCLESCDQNVTYKYLGKSLALSGEDSFKVIEMIDTYSDLVHKIQQCNLPLALKASAFNSLALGKILHHFYNTRLTEEQLEKLDNLLTSAACDLYGLYKSTTSLVIYLPCEHGSIGVKRISDVYRSTRLAFLIKMLNHDVTQFNEVARYSLKLDMEKRGVPTTQERENVFGYKLKNDSHLDTKTLFGCQSDWPDMLRYARKLGVIVTYFNEKAIVRIGDKCFDDSCSFQKVLFRLTVDRDLEKAKTIINSRPVSLFIWNTIKIFSFSFIQLVNSR